MIESLDIQRWIYTTLAGDALLMSLLQGRVYPNLAPQGSPYPFIIFAFMGGFDINNRNQERLYVTDLWMVKLIVFERYTETDVRAADRMDDLLCRPRTKPFDYLSLTSWREGEITYSEHDVRLPGDVYIHLGGMYRFNAYYR